MKPAVVFEKAPKWWPRVAIPLSTACLVVLGVLGVRQCGGDPEVAPVVEVDAGVPVSAQTPLVCDDCDAIALAARGEAQAKSEETVQRLKDALSVCVARKPAKGSTKKLADKLRAAERKLAAAEGKLAARKERPKAKTVVAKEAPAPTPEVVEEPAELPKEGPDVVAEHRPVPAPAATRNRPRSLLEVIEAYEKSGP
jgi:hypothetical protein